MSGSSLTDRRLVPVMDLDYDLSCSFHTPELLKRKLELLAEHGFECIHIVAPPEGGANYSSATFLLPPGNDCLFARSRAAFGELDPLEWAVQCARDAGMEVIIEFKPYEGGGNLILPHGSPVPDGMTGFETLGGVAVGVEPFVAANPRFRLERCPEPEAIPGPVTAIEVAFVTSDRPVSAVPPAVRVYTSSDNGVYLRLERQPEISSRYEMRRIVDGNGLPVAGGESALCRVVRISGIRLECLYFALEFPEDDPETLRSYPFTMAKVFSGGRELPVTISERSREDYVLHRPMPFAGAGFDFAVSGPALAQTGLRPVPVWGFAMGKLRHLRGCLCEAYPEVREYWLERIGRFVEMGASGVDIRLQNHCSGIVDFSKYGFNPPLAEAWRERYGSALDPLSDPLALMRLRGEFFLRFLEEAAALLHRRAARLLCQFHGYMEHPSLSSGRDDAGFWANARVLPDWRRVAELVDELVIKNYNFGEYRSETADGIKQLAAELGKPLWVHCYLQQGHDWRPDFLRALNRDPRVTGILLYEVVWNEREKDGIVKVCGNRVEWVFDPEGGVRG